MAQSGKSHANGASFQANFSQQVARPRIQADSDLPAVDWRGRRVTLMGLGRHGGGVGAARYLASHGARVTISETADAGTLSSSLSQLADSPIEAVHLGGHDDRDFASAEFVVVNPAVRPDHVCLQLARTAGARVTTEIELFLAHCPANVIGITGSNGKTTTASMLAAMLAAGGRRAWLGGNIGGSLLESVDSMRHDDWVVLELSSFQLAHLDSSARWPRIALVTNCTDNHLDWHRDFESYAAAKKRLLSTSRVGGVNIINVHDRSTSAWPELHQAEVVESWPLDRLPTLRLLGDHNRQNAACAAAAAELAGIDEQIIVENLTGFTGLPHRIEWVAVVAGRRFYDDSKSTSPAATLAALAALDGPVWLLAGGEAKGADFMALAERLVDRVAGVAAFGTSRYALCAALVELRADFNVIAVEQMADALAWCWQRSRNGDAILLSPAAASYDQFRDYHERGETFCALVRAMESTAHSGA
jgi:UDP-N-acetylmuramoylalanine--D-glutamate ligase